MYESWGRVQYSKHTQTFVAYEGCNDVEESNMGLLLTDCDLGQVRRKYCRYVHETQKKTVQRTTMLLK